jgi:hypothetical protein
MGPASSPPRWAEKGDASSALAELADWSPDLTHAQTRREDDTEWSAVQSGSVCLTP